MKSLLERAARAVCTAQGLPENIIFEGRPMWESFLPSARAMLLAMRATSPAMELAARDAAALDDPALVWTAIIDAALAETDETT